jgi:hypothetical protein
MPASPSCPTRSHSPEPTPLVLGPTMPAHFRPAGWQRSVPRPGRPGPRGLLPNHHRPRWFACSFFLAGPRRADSSLMRQTCRPRMCPSEAAVIETTRQYAPTVTPPRTAWRLDSRPLWYTGASGRDLRRFTWREELPAAAVGMADPPVFPVCADTSRCRPRRAGNRGWDDAPDPPHHGRRFRTGISSPSPSPTSSFASASRRSRHPRASAPPWRGSPLTAVVPHAFRVLRRLLRGDADPMSLPSSPYPLPATPARRGNFSGLPSTRLHGSSGPSVPPSPTNSRYLIR